MAQSKIKAIMSTFDTANLTVGYLVVNATGFPGPCSLLHFTNKSDSHVFISYDGVNNHDAVLPQKDLLLDFQANNAPNGNVAKLPTKTKVYVSAAAANAGLFTVSCYYQSE